MGKQVIRLTENDLHKIIKESVKRIIKERELGADEKFTPYTPEEAERNRKAHTWGTPEQRNPSYAKAKAEAARRKSKGSMEEGLDEIGDTEKGQAALGALNQRLNTKGRNATQEQGLSSQEASNYYNRADNVRDYASQQRQNQRNGLNNQHDVNLSNAYDRGRQARQGYENHRMSPEQYRGVVNKGWKEGWQS